MVPSFFEDAFALSTTDFTETTASINTSHFSQNHELCDCTLQKSDCTFPDYLHNWYFVGSLLSIIGGLTVIISYILLPQLRYHPSVVIFYRSIIDLGVGLCFFSLYFINPFDLHCNQYICDRTGQLILFLFLSSIFYLITLLNDLRIATTNPFSSPYKRSILKTNIIIISVAVIMSSFANIHGWSYRYDLQYCDIAEFSDKKWSVNPYNAFCLYLPIVFAVIFGIIVTSKSFLRLRKGLPNTFNVRKKAIRAAWSYCIVYALYIMVIGFFYTMTWIEDIGADHGTHPWYRSFALTTSALGFSDFIVFFIVNYGKFKKCIKNRKKIRFMKNIGISVVKDKSKRSKTINEALMLEVLAYTTDGIAQAVGWVKDVNSSLDYPTSITDYRTNVITRKHVQIGYNWAVTLIKHKKAAHMHRRLNSNVRLGPCCLVIASGNYSSGLRQRDLVSVDPDALLTRNIPPDNSSDQDTMSSGYVVQSDSKYSKQREFTDYAPLIFKHIRTCIIGITDSEYISSMIPSTKSQQIKVLEKTKCGEGKSGAFFYITHDGKYVVKTIPKHEVQKFLGILKKYVLHLERYTQTIISRCVGLHSIKIYGLRQYFVVMENVFVAQLKPNEVYDLKGSWVRRITNARLDAGTTMKDLDFRKNVILDKRNRDNIIKQLDIDSKFLADNNIMDYSLLLGIYYMKIKCQQYASKPSIHLKVEQRVKSLSMRNIQLSSVKDVNESQTSSLKSSVELHPIISGSGSTISKNDNDNVELVIKKDININDNDIKYDGVDDGVDDEEEKTDEYLGGVRARIVEGPGIYYFGIIDTLQDYNWSKKMEHFLKTVIKRESKKGLSCVEPKLYQKRFIKYMSDKIISDKEYERDSNLTNVIYGAEQVLIYPPSDAQLKSLNIIKEQRARARTVAKKSSYYSS